ncbi:MAG: DUF429 domain-containing protein [Rhodopila sp.]
MDAVVAGAREADRVVLGIDAAWTTGQPSGVALVAAKGDDWRCLAVAPSYQQFIACAAGEPVDWARRPPAGSAEVTLLLAAVRGLAGRESDVIAVDMPLAAGLIIGRRACDTSISRRFGAAGAAVHSPTPQRPGPVAEQLRRGLEAHGYSLAVSAPLTAPFKVVVETYPHPVAMELCDSRRRVPYKQARIARYWPDLSPLARREQLLRVWVDLLQALQLRIADIGLPAPVQIANGSSATMKGWEDALDGLLCAWAGTHLLAGTATAYGDHTAAIWLPTGCEDYRARPDRYPTAINASRTGP